MNKLIFANTVVILTPRNRWKTVYITLMQFAKKVSYYSTCYYGNYSNNTSGKCFPSPRPLNRCALVQCHEKCSCSSQEHANDLLTRKQTKMFPVKMPQCRNEGRRVH